MANGMIQNGLRMNGGWTGRAGEVGGRVGADRPEGHIAEVEQPGEADDHVEAHGQQDVDGDLGSQDRLDADTHVQWPLDCHQQRGDRDSVLAVGEPALFGDPGELIAARPGTRAGNAQDVGHRPGQSPHHDGCGHHHDHDARGAVVRQDVDRGQPAGDGVRGGGPPLRPRRPHQPPIGGQDDAGDSCDPSAPTGRYDLSRCGEGQQQALDGCQAYSEPPKDAAQGAVVWHGPDPAQGFREPVAHPRQYAVEGEEPVHGQAGDPERTGFVEVDGQVHGREGKTGFDAEAAFPGVAP